MRQNSRQAVYFYQKSSNTIITTFHWGKKSKAFLNHRTNYFFKSKKTRTDSSLMRSPLCQDLSRTFTLIAHIIKCHWFLLNIVCIDDKLGHGSTPNFGNQHRDIAFKNHRYNQICGLKYRSNHWLKSRIKGFRVSER